MKFIKLQVLVFLAVFLIPFTIALNPSHPASQVILPDGTTLAVAVPSGEKICTNSNGLCASASSQWGGTSPGPIYYPGGNVGIGTSSPQLKLVIGDTTANQWKIGIAGGGNVNAWRGIAFTDANGGAVYGGIKFINDAGSDSSLRFLTWAGVPGGTERMVIRGTGNVGIGVPDPTEKLEVNGKVKATNTLKTFIGATTNKYDGFQVNGYSGGDSRCNFEYPGSRMCMTADFINGKPTQSGWYSTFTFSVFNFIGEKITDCDGWKADNTVFGSSWDSANSKPSAALCSTQQPVLCCS